MLTLIFIISLILTIILAVLIQNEISDGIFTIISLISFSVFVLVTIYTGVFLGIAINDISSSHSINSKIEIYEEENAKIYSYLKETVEKYYKDEPSYNIFSTDTPEGCISILSDITELSNNDVVIIQSREYLSNKREILSLKEKKADLSTTKWLLYFGH